MGLTGGIRPWGAFPDLDRVIKIKEHTARHGAFDRIGLDSRSNHAD